MERCIYRNNISSINYSSIKSIENVAEDICVKFSNGAVYKFSPRMLMDVFEYPNLCLLNGEWILTTDISSAKDPVKIPKLSEMSISACRLETNLLGESCAVNVFYNDSYALQIVWDSILALCENKFEFFRGYNEESIKKVKALENNGYLLSVPTLSYSDIRWHKVLDIFTAETIDNKSIGVTLYMGDTYTISESKLVALYRATSIKEFLGSLSNSKTAQGHSLTVTKVGIKNKMTTLRIAAENSFLCRRKHIEISGLTILMLCDERFEYYWKKIDLSVPNHQLFAHRALSCCFPNELLCIERDWISS